MKLKSFNTESEVYQVISPEFKMEMSLAAVVIAVCLCCLNGRSLTGPASMNGNKGKGRVTI